MRKNSVQHFSRKLNNIVEASNSKCIFQKNVSYFTFTDTKITIEFDKIWKLWFVETNIKIGKLTQIRFCWCTRSRPIRILRDNKQWLSTNDVNEQQTNRDYHTRPKPPPSRCFFPSLHSFLSPFVPLRWRDPNARLLIRRWPKRIPAAGSSRSETNDPRE